MRRESIRAALELQGFTNLRAVHHNLPITTCAGVPAHLLDPRGTWSAGGARTTSKPGAWQISSARISASSRAR